jgi:hypothetical protein
MGYSKGRKRSLGIFICFALIFMSRFPAGAQGGSLASRCSRDNIAQTLNESAQAEKRGDASSIAQASTKFALELHECFLSGVHGGPSFNSLPSLDLLDAAGSLSRAATNWFRAGNAERGCNALRMSITWYGQVIDDNAASTHQSTGIQVRKLALAGLATARTNRGRYCGQVDQGHRQSSKGRKVRNLAD